MSRIRRGPKRLDDTDDNPCLGAGSSSEADQSPVSEERDSRQKSSPSQQTPTHQSQTWGSWFSSVAQKTQQGLDRLYEMANQPIKINDVDEEEDLRKETANALEDLIANAHKTSSASPSPTSDPVRQAISKLSTMAIAAKSKFNPTRSVDELEERSIDDAFRLHDGLLFTEQLLQRGAVVGKQWRREWRGRTPTELDVLSERVDKVERLFDSESLLSDTAIVGNVESVTQLSNELVTDKKKQEILQRIDEIIIEPFDDPIVMRNRLGELTALFCHILLMIDNFKDAKSINELSLHMLGLVKTLAKEAKLFEDGQYCQHLIVGAVYHLMAPCKLALLEVETDTIDSAENEEMHDTIEE